MKRQSLTIPNGHTRSLAFYIATFVLYIYAVYPMIAITFRLEELRFGANPYGSPIDFAELMKELATVHWASIIAAMVLGGVIPGTVTHRFRARLATALAAAETANRKQREFISVISHEFRTPLTAIQGFSELMSEDDLPPAQVREFAHDINTDARRLARMVNEILDLDRLESGRTKITPVVVDLSAYVHEAVDDALVVAPTHRYQNDVGPIAVRADPDKLTQVLTNLVTNATKYTPAGSTIIIRAVPRGEMIEVIVEDNGPGIAPELLERIFERYYRVEAKNGAHVAGTGLGLAIVRQIVELHGGRVWCESELGHGAAFHFTLPAAAAIGRAA